MSGTPYSLPEAAASTLGIKLQPQDVDLGFTYYGLEFGRIENQLQAQARTAGRQYERGIITKPVFDQTIKTIQDKLRDLGADFELAD
jgi:polysaccharide deacetylase 2 family uncharacterized protein YibQ